MQTVKYVSAMKIHCSHPTYESLHEIGGFSFVPRGEIDIKVLVNCNNVCSSDSGDSRMWCNTCIAQKVLIGHVAMVLPSWKTSTCNIRADVMISLLTIENKTIKAKGWAMTVGPRENL